MKTFLLIVAGVALIPFAVLFSMAAVGIVLGILSAIVEIVVALTAVVSRSILAVLYRRRMDKRRR